jgi:hypothetical protein
MVHTHTCAENLLTLRALAILSHSNLRFCDIQSLYVREETVVPCCMSEKKP